MKENSNQQAFTWQAKTDKPLIARETGSERILELSLKAKPKDSDEKRSPLNLGLVIDRSGSMSGEPLSFVRKAAAHILGLLEPKDRVAVITYDDTIQTLFPSNLMTEEARTEAVRRVKGIQSGGSTNLFGGWMRGCEETAQSATEASFNRVMLLTDGLANVGIQQPSELAYHANQLFKRGISTSTFGVGLGYDEHLLEQMSSNGGGSFHYLETINAIPLVFEREFLELISFVLRDLSFTLVLPKSMNASVLAGYPFELDEQEFKVFPGSLYANSDKQVYIKLRVKQPLVGQELSIPVRLKGVLEDGATWESEIVLTLPVVEEKTEKATQPDLVLMKRYTEVQIADDVAEALKKEREGDRAGAARTVRQSLSSAMPYQDKVFMNSYSHMAMEMEAGLDDYQRKSRHRAQYNMKMGRNQVLDYRARLEKGCLFAEIEGKQVLIDTGSPVSLGEEPEWMFFNQVYPLVPDAMGVSLREIRKSVGVPIDVFMGTDILKDFHLVIDLPDAQVHFSRQPLAGSAVPIPLKTLMGTPILRTLVNGQEIDMVLDTGSKLSYV